MPYKNKKIHSASSHHDGGAFLRRKVIITTIVSIILIGGITLLYIFVPAFINKSNSQAIIKIPANASAATVRDSLAKYLGDKYADNTLRIASIRKTDFSKRHGAYLIDSGVTPFNAERKLASGVQHPVKIIINSHRGIDKAAAKISPRLDFSSDSLIHQISDSEYLENYNLKPEQALALLIDDTYEVYWSASPKDVLDKIGSNYKKIWNSERLEKANKLGLSPAEVITLASIVDEETNKKDERPKVARLYLNRLNKGMRLQADPTVKFALGDFSLRRIRNEHLKVESPYNTYLHAGLPPGPIRTVTMADIDAVLNAPLHDYIYMCAKDDFSGYHNFAKDYTSHMHNARKYQKALNQRNIK